MTVGRPAADTSPSDAFAGSRELFEAVVEFLDTGWAGGLTRGELEDRLAVDGRALLRELFQDHLDLRAERETRLVSVVDADGVPCGAARWAMSAA